MYYNKPMKYFLAGNIKTNLSGLEKLIELAYLEPDDKLIDIDMANLKFLDANLISVMAAILFQKYWDGYIVKLSNIKSKIRDIFERNHFFPSDNETFNPQETVMEFKVFSPDSVDDFIKYINEQLLDKSQFPKMADSYKKQIRSKIQELFANAVEHGKAKHIYCCGQHFPKNGVMNFTIVNLGTTIKDNVNMYLNESLEASKAIEWASKEGHSTAVSESNPTRGLGLSLLHDFIIKNNGELSILSDNGFWGIRNKEQCVHQVAKIFSGTIINIIVNVNDPKEYGNPIIRGLEEFFTKKST